MTSELEWVENNDGSMINFILSIHINIIVNVNVHVMITSTDK